MSGSTLPTPAQYLASLDQAYLALVGGAQVRSVTDQNGESVAYTMSNATTLLNLIRTIAAIPGIGYQPLSLGACQNRRPLQFWF